MKVFSTKYALSKGIEEVEGEVKSYSPDFFYYNDGKNYLYCHGNEFHTSLESAKNKANIMLYKRKQTLRRQLEKLEKMEF